MANILVISYYINSDGVACSHHIDDRIAELIKLGHSVIICSACFVPLLNSVRHLRFSSLSPGGFRFETRQRLKDTKLSLWHRLILRMFLILNQIPYAFERLAFRRDVTWSWAKPASRGIIRKCERKDIDLIYSTGGPAVAHLVALLVTRSNNIPWIAELQDPLIHSYCSKSKGELNKLIELEKNILSKSIKTFFLTKNAAKAAENRTQIRGKAFSIYSGAPEVQSANVAPLKKVHPRLILGHFGSLGGIRNLASFISAMKIAIKERPEIETDLQINLYGNLANDDRVRINKVNLNKNFVESGTCSREKALTRMMECTALFLIQGEHDISIETIPSKTYEYLNTGKFIFALVHQNKEINHIVSSAGGMVAEVSNLEEISIRLLDLHKIWKKDFCLPSTSRNNYLVKESVAKMLSISLKD